MVDGRALNANFFCIYTLGTYDLEIPTAITDTCVV